MFPYNKLSVEIFGASHAPCIGVRINGIPRDTAVDAELVQQFVDKRRAGQNPWSTPRKEPDEIVFTKGLQNGVVVGEIEGVIYNQKAKSSDYSPYKDTPRPSHADYVAVVKDGENVDLAGGGRFSGRMTAPLCIAGGIALQILEKLGVKILAYVSEIGGIKGLGYADGLSAEQMTSALKSGAFSLSSYDEMVQKVISAKDRGDSVGGEVECVVFGAKVGLGDALFGGLESKISASVFAVPAVKSVEFGLGKNFAKSLGSEVNDAFCFDGNSVKTVTNNNGGINGGISNGMPITVRATLKPTPSISLPQKTVNLSTGEETVIQIKGRHDACIVPRAVYGIQSAVALAVLDAYLEENLL